MEAPERLTVPPSWVHVDLQRLRSRLEAHQTSERVNELRMYQSAISLRVSNLERSTARRHRRLEWLKEELQALTAEQEEEVRLQELGRHVGDGTRNQAYYQRSTSKSYFVPTMAVASSVSEIPPPCPLSLYGFSVSHGSPAAPSTSPSEEAVNAFLKLCAPLFQWSAEEGVVKAPFFFDEPCLLERCARELVGHSAPSVSPVPAARAARAIEDDSSEMRCHNAACAYWHCDQLAHMRMAVQFLTSSFDDVCVRDEQLCCVRHLLCRLTRQVHRAESVTLICALVCETLQKLIGLGLCVPLTEGRKQPSFALIAPLVPKPEVRPASNRQRLMVLLPKSEMSLRFGQVLKQCPAAPSGRLLCAAATQDFQRHRDALSWRCLLACADDAAQRHWLARQGVQLFPCCPQLHLVHLLCCVQRAASVEDVIEACLSSCRTLSAQAAASVVAGLDGGQYGTAVARHVGYMIALALVHCAAKDAARALQFVSPLLSTDAEAGLAALLLPTARQNLALMTVALRRTGHLHGVEHLPLAAVSDHAFTLADPDGANPADSGRDVVYGAFQLIHAYKRNRFDPHLTTACAGALQVSLLRTFTHRLAYVERVAEKTAPESALAQSAVYGVYVAAVAEQQSVPAAVAVAEALAAADGSSCTLTLLLGAQLRTWGCPATPDAATAVTAFCATAQVPAEALESPAAVRAAAAAHAAVSAAEWVAAYALRWCCGKGGDGEEAWSALLGFPVEILVDDAAAAALCFSILLHRSAALSSALQFHTAVHRCLSYFRELHMRAWEPLDASYASMVGLPHYAGLLIYRDVPRLLGAGARATAEWRRIVLAAAIELEVLHPLLIIDSPDA